MTELLKLLCLFTVSAAGWLVLMENVLRHPGYGERVFLAIAIVLQSLATLLFLPRIQFAMRALILLGGVGLIVLGGSALIRICQAPHFEGFVLIIAAALMVQGSLTVTATILKCIAA